MAKHGGYPMGMMGGGNMQALMKQAQKMQENMAKKQAELNEQTFTASAGGGMVTATVYGTKKLESVKIDPQCVDPDDVEMLEDLVAAAVNDAIRQVDETTESEMGKITGGLNIPGLG